MTRQTDLAKIHIGKKKLGLDDETYRELLMLVTGKDSSSLLDFTDRFKVIEHLKQKGVKFTSNKNSVTQASKANKPRIKKIYALWFLLYKAGEAHNKTPKTIDTWCSKITGKQRLVWATSYNLNQCIESLKKWCTRVGVSYEQ